MTDLELVRYARLVAALCVRVSRAPCPVCGDPGPRAVRVRPRKRELRATCSCGAVVSASVMAPTAEPGSTS